MFGVDLIGGLIASYVLSAVLLAAILVLATGVILAWRGKRKAGIGCIVGSLLIAIPIGGIFIDAFKPLPHRNVEINFMNPALTAWVVNDSRCHEMGRGGAPEHLCINDDYNNALKVILPDGFIIQAKGINLSFFLNKKDQSIKSFSFHLPSTMSVSDLSSFIRTETARWKQGAKNEREIMERAKEAIDWLHRFDANRPSFSSKRICADRQNYTLCLEIRALVANAGFSILYEISAESGLTPATVSSGSTRSVSGRTANLH